MLRDLTKALRDLGHGNFTVHGFRSSFRDGAAKQTATPGDMVEAALAHTIRNRVGAAYRRTNYFDKRVALMDDWVEFPDNARQGNSDLIADWGPTPTPCRH